ncbi:hypothetical protein CEE39_03165 [bacterium (candidate division B38) B3_B38]|nr:MAG: hypothetical protein CEE39_03165 [bacterium (candidate division B38) B3_B38]
MHIDLKEVTPKGLHLSRNINLALPPSIEEVDVINPCFVELKLTPIGTKYRIIGSIRLKLKLQCSRCSESYPFDLFSDFDLLYLPIEKMTSEVELELKDKDANIAYYSEDRIELLELLQEQVLLALPMKPICSEECKGLCLSCGTNLNISSCNCKSVSIDPRLEKLKKIKELFNK